jgi:hypothetical protein
MAAYRKKPVVVEAMQWFAHGDHPKVKRTSYLEMSALMGGSSGCCRCPKMHTWEVLGVVETPEGLSTICPGDWVVMGVKGEFYPVKHDIFEATFELVVEP